MYTVYCKSFEVEKFRGFRGLLGDCETFPAKHLFVLVFKLECHGQTLQEENRTVNAIYSWLFRIPLPLLIRLISRVHAVGTLHSSIAETVAQATLCDFPLDTILQPHCLAMYICQAQKATR